MAEKMKTALAIVRPGDTALSVARAREILAHCKTVDVAKDIKDRAKAVAAYLRDKKDATVARDDAFEIALRAERRMGELLALTMTPRQGAGRPKIGSLTQPISPLKALGVSKEESVRAQKLAALPEKEFDGRIKTTREKSERLTVKGLLATTAATDHDGNAWMTPPDHIERARRVLGGIDLDPASSAEANNIVRAKAFFTKEQDGLAKAWAGKVWLNPPFSNPLVARFVERLVKAHDSGSVPRAILLVNSATDVSWFQDLMARFPVCFTRGRIAFVLPGGRATKGNMYGQAFFFIGCDMNTVRREFGQIGAILGRMR